MWQALTWQLLLGFSRNGLVALHYSDEMVQALERVLWIGGAPDSGKTSVATLIATKYALPIYHFDRHEMAHFARANPVEHPALWAAHPDRMTTEQRWLGSPPQAMAEATIAGWSERSRMAFEDLADIPGEGSLIAEGPGFFPGLIAPLLSDARKAVWLVPTEEFKRRSALARGKPGSRHETSDPEQATTNIIARDLIMGRRIREQCEALDMAVITVTGDEGIDEVVRRVERHLASWL
jgi:hypothetical protein